ncbi:MAG: N-acetylmuramoyl-L-alanine amidase [Rhodobacteraceae bacterium]|nr:N-acetylmuramoyl-L-alanine amidase [Paracoccaceae bacterium]
MKRLAIVVGHNSEKQGAVRGDTGETEFVWNSDMAKMIEGEAQAYPDLEVKTFYRQPGLGYTREIRRVYEETDRWGANATVELHFNSSASPNASGAETLTSGTPASMALAVSVNQEMVAALGLKDRGVKTRSASDRGGAGQLAGAVHGDDRIQDRLDPLLQACDRRIGCSPHRPEELHRDRGWHRCLGRPARRSGLLDLSAG